MIHVGIVTMFDFLKVLLEVAVFIPRLLISQMASLRERLKARLGFITSGLRGRTSIQRFVLGGFEAVFYRIGLRVAQHPILTILACFILTGICGIGFLKMRKENNVLKLWISETSSSR